MICVDWRTGNVAIVEGICLSCIVLKWDLVQLLCRVVQWPFHSCESNAQGAWSASAVEGYFGPTENWCCVLWYWLGRHPQVYLFRYVCLTNHWRVKDAFAKFNCRVLKNIMACWKDKFWRNVLCLPAVVGLFVLTYTMGKKVSLNRGMKFFFWVVGCVK